MGHRPQKIWRFKGHRVLTWTEDDGVGAGLRLSGRVREGRFERNQDERSVIPLEAAEFDQWLEGAVDKARALMMLAQMEGFDAGPTDAAQKEIA